MKYSPDENGFFDGQRGYGYLSLEKFIDAAREVTAGKKKAEDYEGKGLPTAKAVLVVLLLACPGAGHRGLKCKGGVLTREIGF